LELQNASGGYSVQLASRALNPLRNFYSIEVKERVAIIKLGSFEPGISQSIRNDLVEIQNSQNVQGYKKERKTLQADIAKLQEEIHALELEWLYLNRPQRLHNLAIGSGG
ncbi:MAG: hypothetical protein AAGC62_15380, partial [Pseudomonadota bacterium]